MRESNRHLIETNVAGICYRETESDIEVLIAKRKNNRDIYPGKWETGAGQVREGENFEEAIQRQMTEELGVCIKNVVVFKTYEIDMPRLDQKKIPGVMFVCLWDGYINEESPTFSQDEFTEGHWQSINKLSEIDLVPGLERDIRMGWEFYSMYKTVNSRGYLERLKASKF
jgi:8-oxo-dGTP pyrophosphatase MutT (NUDIX family)